MTKKKKLGARPPILYKASLLAAIITGIIASLCCLGPLILLTLGVGGVWLGMFSYLKPIRPLAIVLTFLFLSLAFWKLYIKPSSCSSDGSCFESKNLRFRQVIFWIVALLSIAFLGFPWYAFLFY